ncbi:CDP-alcohol phosphatidyltransferase family protein [Candidatus Dojkabacteria bacterium]|uniref:CDP-alcohol phosphatidyltransferase family protein n=1 Tax=Candidatus Dojkabacteria bacterium TaxID=2099670 RepID=A0A955RJ06_9BACT|nr:CDP-alcohol phosphatidyltransferase family protein [Candidatus Dojkabacteria bacterium]
MPNKFTRNIPNYLSVSRLFLLPFMLYLSFKGHPNSFAAVLIVYGITDTLDGNIARYFNITSELGAKLDSLVDDIGNTFLGIFFFLLFPQIFWENLYQILMIIALFILVNILKVTKLKEVGLHFYSAKVAQLFTILIVLQIIYWGFNSVLFNLWFITLLVFSIESILAIIFFFPTTRTRTIFQLIKKG